MKKWSYFNQRLASLLLFKRAMEALVNYEVNTIESASADVLPRKRFQT